MRQKKMIFEKAGVKLRLPYLLYLPPDYDPARPRALTLFLHGMDERGTEVENILLHGLPKEIEGGRQLPFLTVSPQCPVSTYWNYADAIESLVALLDDIQASYSIDPDRIYVTGLGMGGAGTWALAIHQLKRFAALVPICGGGNPNTVVALKHIPIWVFHGDQDQKLPLARSVEMVNALKAVGGNVKLTVYEGAGHDAWTQTFANPQLYEWMMQQKRA